MLPRESRLRASQDFQRVYRQGRSTVSPLVVVYVLPLASGEGAVVPRAGFVASKKVGKAHDRNLAKRRIRESYRLHVRPTGPDTLMVWVVRPAAAAATYAQIDAAVKGLLHKIGWLGPCPSESRPVALSL